MRKNKWKLENYMSEFIRISECTSNYLCYFEFFSAKYMNLAKLRMVFLEFDYIILSNLVRFGQWQ